MPDYYNQPGAAAAATYPPPPNTAPLSLLGDVNQQVNHAFGRVLALSGQVQTIADGIFGAQPSETIGNKNGAIQAAPARAESIRNDLSALHIALGSLESQVNRLASLT